MQLIKNIKTIKNMAVIGMEIEVDLEGFFFPDLINELEHLIHNKEKGELDDYDCHLLHHLILAIQRRPEFKKYKVSVKKTVISNSDLLLK